MMENMYYLGCFRLSITSKEGSSRLGWGARIRRRWRGKSGKIPCGGMKRDSNKSVLFNRVIVKAIRLLKKNNPKRNQKQPTTQPKQSPKSPKIRNQSANLPHPHLLHPHPLRATKTCQHFQNPHQSLCQSSPPQKPQRSSHHHPLNLPLQTMKCNQVNI